MRWGVESDARLPCAAVAAYGNGLYLFVQPTGTRSWIRASSSVAIAVSSDSAASPWSPSGRGP